MGKSISSRLAEVSVEYINARRACDRVQHFCAETVTGSENILLALAEIAGGTILPAPNPDKPWDY
jgi:enhancing lycopene biosynthesis protein 2